MDRDRRLTGWLRGQVDRPIAPAGFEYSNGWRVCGYTPNREFASWTLERLTRNNRSRRTCTRKRYKYRQLRTPHTLFLFCISFSGAQSCYERCFFSNTNSVPPYLDSVYRSNELTTLHSQCSLRVTMSIPCFIRCLACQYLSLVTSGFEARD